MFCVGLVTILGPTSTDFSKFFFKIRSYGTIHTFKNYFAIVLSVFNFQFSNKRYPKKLLVLTLSRIGTKLIGFVVSATTEPVQ